MIGAANGTNRFSPGRADRTISSCMSLFEFNFEARIGARRAMEKNLHAIAIHFLVGVAACARAETTDATPDKPSVLEFVCKPRDIAESPSHRSGCIDPIAVPDRAGKDSGFVCCADGSINRVEKRVLSSFPDDECSADADCSEDSVCFPGTIFERGAPNGCAHGFDCDTNAACESNECGLMNPLGASCGEIRVLLCRKEFDRCRSTFDCTDGNLCTWAIEHPTNDDEFVRIWKCDNVECDDLRSGQP
jgi:hypothetical protein